MLAHYSYVSGTNDASFLEPDSSKTSIIAKNEMPKAKTMTPMIAQVIPQHWYLDEGFIVGKLFMI